MSIKEGIEINSLHYVMLGRTSITPFCFHILSFSSGALFGAIEALFAVYNSESAVAETKPLPRDERSPSMEWARAFACRRPHQKSKHRSSAPNQSFSAWKHLNPKGDQEFGHMSLLQYPQMLLRLDWFLSRCPRILDRHTACIKGPQVPVPGWPPVLLHLRNGPCCDRPILRSPRIHASHSHEKLPWTAPPFGAALVESGRMAQPRSHHLDW